jgi:hypothetical protein
MFSHLKKIFVAVAQRHERARKQYGRHTKNQYFTHTMPAIIIGSVPIAIPGMTGKFISIISEFFQSDSFSGNSPAYGLNLFWT